MAVDRCVCLDVSFRRLLALQDEHGWGLERLREETGCCSGCGMCEPYVRLALATGKTTLPVLTDDEVREAMRLGSEPTGAGCSGRSA